MVSIRNAGFPGSRPGDFVPPERKPEPARPSRGRADIQISKKTNLHDETDQHRLLREMRNFLKRHPGMTRTDFCTAVGQSSNSNNGLFIKAQEGRLRTATVEKVRRYMLEYEA